MGKCTNFEARRAKMPSTAQRMMDVSNESFALWGRMVESRAKDDDATPEDAIVFADAISAAYMERRMALLKHNM